MVGTREGCHYISLTCHYISRSATALSNDALRANNCFGGPQFGAAGAGVSQNLLFSGGRRLRCQDAQLRLMTTHTDRQVGWADTILRLTPHKLFDPPVL